MDVVVLDKATFPRDKVCAGWITPAVVDEVQLDTADYARGRVFQPITGFRVCQLGRRFVHVTYDRPVSYGIRRCEFDHYLLERSGAKLRLGEPLKSLRRDGDRWIVNDAISAALVVGAGGHFCPVARQVTDRAGRASETTVVAQEVEYHLPAEQVPACKVEGEVPELFFCRDFLGYAWVFRKGGYLNIGLGRAGERNLTSHVAEFCNELKRLGRVPADIPDDFQGHAYRLYRHEPRRLTRDGVVLIGDSAGLAYPESGEGIRPAIESGMMAAQIIREARGDYSLETLERLREQILARFGRPLSNGWGAKLPAGWTAWIGGQLLRTKWFTQRVVLERWFLHRHVPALQV
jgi:flavin-dependent dehydrogenase